MILFQVLKIHFLILSAYDCFNIETTKPTVFLGQQYGSHFGYSIALYKSDEINPKKGWVIVGAPETNTTEGTVGHGATYACDYQSQNCTVISSINQHPRTSQINRVSAHYYYYHSDGTQQRLGSTVRASEKIGGSILICAPNYFVERHLNKTDNISKIWYPENEPIGKCFLIDSTFTAKREIMPYLNTNWTYAKLGFSQTGFSAEISNECIYLSTPGAKYWTGNVYQTGKKPGLLLQQSDTTDDDKFTYIGYSIARGNFNYGKEALAVSAPRSDYFGEVRIYGEHLLVKKLSGEQLGAYFGYSLAAADVNGDGLQDLIVTAPFHSIESNKFEGHYETGKAYIYLQSPHKHNNFKNPIELTGFAVKSRFGTAVCSLGDINDDGYEDFAISAPYEVYKSQNSNEGKVYVYLGSKVLLNNMKPAQILQPSETQSGVKTFGFALSGGIDIDGNKYPDLAVSAVDSEQVFVYLTRSVVKMTTHMSTKKIEFENEEECLIKGRDCLLLTSCLMYNGKGLVNRSDFAITWQFYDSLKKLKPSYPHSFKENKLVDMSLMTLKFNETSCHNAMIYINSSEWKLEPIKIKMEYILIENTEDEINSLKPFLDPKIAYNSIVLHECGSYNNSLCSPDLRLSVKTITNYTYGSKDNIHVFINVINYGQNASESIISINLPPGFKYHSYKQITNKILDCSSNLNELSCNLLGVLVNLDEVKLQIILTPDPINIQGRSYELFVKVNSSISEETHKMTDNHILTNITVNFDTQLKIFRSSFPLDKFIIVNQKREQSNGSIVQSEEDLGPELIHIFSIENHGLSLIDTGELTITWPLTLKDNRQYFMYLLDEPQTTENLECQHSIDLINPKKFLISLNSSKIDYLMLGKELKLQDDHFKHAEETVEDDGPGDNVENQDDFFNRTKRSIEDSTLIEKCTELNCVTLKCTFKFLNSKESADIALRFRIVSDSVRDFPNSTNIAFTHVKAKVTLLPFNTEPDLIQTIQAQIITEIKIPPEPSKIQIWHYALAAIGGLLILFLFGISLWKCGFFKRHRPPTKEEIAVTEYAEASLFIVPNAQCNL